MTTVYLDTFNEPDGPLTDAPFGSYTFIGDGPWRVISNYAQPPIGEVNNTVMFDTGLVFCSVSVEIITTGEYQDDCGIVVRGTLSEFLRVSLHNNVGFGVDYISSGNSWPLTDVDPDGEDGWGLHTVWFPIPNEIVFPFRLRVVSEDTTGYLSIYYEDGTGEVFLGQCTTSMFLSNTMHGMTSNGNADTTFNNLWIQTGIISSGDPAGDSSPPPLGGYTPPWGMSPIGPNTIPI